MPQAARANNPRTKNDKKAINSNLSLLFYLSSPKFSQIINSGGLALLTFNHSLF
jgi:hypothetical protein